MNKRFSQAAIIISGPAVAILSYFGLATNIDSASGATQAALITLAVGIWMAVWWITEAIGLARTAAIPLLIFPLLGVRPLTDVASSYIHPLIFLFLGGFIVSIALQKWALDQRFALFVLRLVGTDRNRLVAGVMAATALLSMWISNTATTIMMLPIVLSLIRSDSGTESFARCLLLALAYSASIGGVATIIGTPPNTFVASYLRDALATDIGFAEWMSFALPLALIFLFLAWIYLVFWRFPVSSTSSGAASFAAREQRRLRFPEYATIGIFATVAAMWLARRWLNGVVIAGTKPFSGLTDAYIAMGGAIVLLVFPARSRVHRTLLNLGDLRAVPWSTLVLFGGGLALSSTIKETGADKLIGQGLAHLPPLEPFLVLSALVAFVIFATELTSNIATTATLVPILAASSQVFGLEAVTVIVATAFSASCAFMLPVATPPNAIVYGSGKVSAREMARTGFGLNVIAIVLIALFMRFWFPNF